MSTPALPPNSLNVTNPLTCNGPLTKTSKPKILHDDIKPAVDIIKSYKVIPENQEHTINASKIENNEDDFEDFETDIPSHNECLETKDLEDDFEDFEIKVPSQNEGFESNVTSSPDANELIPKYDEKSKSGNIFDEIEALSVQEKNINVAIDAKDSEEKIKNKIFASNIEHISQNVTKISTNSTSQVNIDNSAAAAESSKLETMHSLKIEDATAEQLESKIAAMKDIKTDLENEFSAVQKEMQANKNTILKLHAKNSAENEALLADKTHYQAAAAEASQKKSEVLEKYIGFNRSSGEYKPLTLDQLEQRLLKPHEGEEVCLQNKAPLTEKEKQKALDDIKPLRDLEKKKLTLQVKIKEREAKIDNNQKQINERQQNIEVLEKKSNDIQVQINKVNSEISQLKHALATLIAENEKKAEHTDTNSSLHPPLSKADQPSKSPENRSPLSDLRMLQQSVKNATREINQRNQLMNSIVKKRKREEERKIAEKHKQEIKEDAEAYEDRKKFYNADNLQRDLKTQVFKNLDKQTTEKITSLILDEIEKKFLKPSAPIVEAVEIKEFVQRILLNAISQLSNDEAKILTRNEEKILIETLGRYLGVKQVKRA